jgi:hypothetical protein
MASSRFLAPRRSNPPLPLPEWVGGRGLHGRPDPLPARRRPAPTVALGMLLALALTSAPAPFPGGLGATPLSGQIAVHPTGVNVNASAETVVFLSYGGLVDHDPVEAVWCREIEDAFPDVGSRCVPGTVLGSLPAGFDQATSSGVGGLTDIMTIPTSVALRAREAAAEGGNSEFFYVRRFRSRSGGPDVFVPVTCRLAGGGARVPFALLDVMTSFEVETPIMVVPVEGQLPPLYADIRYNGTGTLQGRWEVVLPGDEAPSAVDRATEGSLPAEVRPTRRIFREVGRFHVFLPPSTGVFRLEGPDPARLPTEVDGPYQVLLRVEATADGEGDSNLAAAGSGTGVVHTGGVAPFAIPPVHYWVGSARPTVVRGGVGAFRDDGRVQGGRFAPRFPVPGAQALVGQGLTLGWTARPGAAGYRVEVTSSEGDPVFQGLVGGGSEQYRMPPWILERPSGTTFRWRVVALDGEGREIDRTAFREVRLRGEGESGGGG